MNTDSDSELDRAENKRALSKKLLLAFFGIMLLLTFFSNTINNYTLPRVGIEYPSSGSLVKEIRASGELIPKMSQSEYTTINARVTAVHVKAGQTVKKGQLVMTLDNNDLMASYEQELLNLKKLGLSGETNQAGNLAGSHDLARKRDEVGQKYAAACRNYERQMQLFQAGAESASNCENAENAMKTSAREYQEACEDYEQGIQKSACDVSAQEIKVAQIKHQLDTGYELRAQCDGLVKEVNFEPGSLANSSKALFVISDQSQGYEFKMTLDSDLAAYLALGDQFTLSLKSMNRSLSGRVSRLAAVSNGKKEVYLDVNANGLAGGESGEAFISKEIGFYDYLVSNSAIQHDTSGAFVWLLRERQGAFRNELYLEKLNVSVINSDGNKTALQKNGIDQDQRIVCKVEDQRPLSEGKRVLLSE